MLEHYTTLLSLLGGNQGLRHARKHLAAYCDHARRNRAAATPLRNRLMTSEDPREVECLIQRIFEDDDHTRVAA